MRRNTDDGRETRPGLPVALDLQDLHLGLSRERLQAAGRKPVVFSQVIVRNHAVRHVDRIAALRPGYGRRARLDELAQIRRSVENIRALCWLS